MAKWFWGKEIHERQGGEERTRRKLGRSEESGSPISYGLWMLPKTCGD